jgi:hypothetical protein
MTGNENWIKFDDGKVSVFLTVPRNLRHSTVTKKILQRISYCTKVKIYDGVMHCVIRRILLHMFLPVAHGCYSMEVDLEHNDHSNQFHAAAVRHMLH